MRPFFPSGRNVRTLLDVLTVGGAYMVSTDIVLESCSGSANEWRHATPLHSLEPAAYKHAAACHSTWKWSLSCCHVHVQGRLCTTTCSPLGWPCICGSAMPGAMPGVPGKYIGGGGPRPIMPCPPRARPPTGSVPAEKRGHTQRAMQIDGFVGQDMAAASSQTAR